jgi:thioredoxin reductase
MSKKKRQEVHHVEVVVIGAGAAGVGVAIALQDADVEDVLVIDRHQVGASFAAWPKETKFLSPSFPTNSIGMLDLNSIAIGTSPAHTLDKEHPTGKEYASYLAGVAQHFKLSVQLNTDVKSIQSSDGLFRIATSQGEISAKFVIWAAGEFRYPNQCPFPGAELCQHTSLIPSYRELPESEFLVIGGYESGIDAAVHLAFHHKKVTVLSRSACWDAESSDPSVSLSTFTKERLAAIQRLDRDIQLVGKVDVCQVTRDSEGYEVRSRDNSTWRSPGPPILATGFLGSHQLIAEHCELREDDYPQLTPEDESTRTPGLFFVGPLVRHDNHIFCFIYKFRQRFAVVAKAIATRLGHPAEDLEQYRKWGMYLDDLSCCGEECVC